MKTKITMGLKRLIQSILENNPHKSINKKQLIGIQIAQFILVKENIIKKSDINGSEIITFNIDECPKKILKTIKSLNKFITLDIEPDYDSKMQITGNPDLITTTLKHNIYCIHALRNSFAHGNYKIKNKHFIINNPISGLKCSIPVNEIIKFNNVCMKHLAYHDTNDIFNLFKKFNHNQYQTSNLNELLHIALYSYASIALSKWDNINLDFSKIIFAYTEVEPTFPNNNHEYQRKKEIVDKIIENDLLKNNETRKPKSIPEKIKTLKEHPSLSFYEDIKNKEQEIQNTLNNTLNQMNNEGIRSLRNSIEHGHYTITSNNNILLEDMTDQNNNESTTFQTITSPEGLFNLINDIYKENLTNDDFSFLYYIVLKENKDFFNQISVAEKHLQEMMELDEFNLVQAPELFEWTIHDLTLPQAWDIIINLNNPYYQKYNIKDSLEILKDYLSNMKISLLNLYNAINFQKQNCIEFYFDTILDPTIPSIDINEMLQSINQYKIVYQELLEAFTILTIVIKQQNSLFTIIDNHNFLQSEIPKTKSLDKHI